MLAYLYALDTTDSQSIASPRLLQETSSSRACFPTVTRSVNLTDLRELNGLLRPSTKSYRKRVTYQLASMMSLADNLSSLFSVFWSMMLMRSCRSSSDKTLLLFEDDTSVG